MGLMFLRLLVLHTTMVIVFINEIVTMGWFF